MLRGSTSIFLAFACWSCFNTAPAKAEDCKPPNLVTSADMLSLGSRQMLVPVSINGTPRLFLLDTGGYTSQLSSEVIKELNLPLLDSDRELRDLSGHASRRGVIADLKLGSLSATHQPLIVSPQDLGMADGILSSDLLVRYDIDMDFGAAKLSYFSPDHCPGNVALRSGQEIAAIPLTLRDRSQMLVNVQLEGKPFQALIDTGSVRSFIDISVAHSIFGLDSNSPGMTPAGPINGDRSLQGYTHTFSSLTFAGVNVTNPTLVIMPDHSGGSALTGGQTSGALGTSLPNLILGMDILQHLHLYMAFKEQRLYVSVTSPFSANTGGGATIRTLAQLDKALALSPTNASILNNRCFQRGMENILLDAALEDCEASLHLRPSHATTFDSKGFVLFRLGRFREALAAYDSALKLDPNLASSLYMRGQTKRKLGNEHDGESDIAAAKAIDAEMPRAFADLGIAD